jgi:hypothetical protein
MIGFGEVYTTYTREMHQSQADLPLVHLMRTTSTGRKEHYHHTTFSISCCPQPVLNDYIANTKTNLVTTDDSRRH